MADSVNGSQYSSGGGNFLNNGRFGSNISNLSVGSQGFTPIRSSAEIKREDGGIGVFKNYSSGAQAGSNMFQPNPRHTYGSDYNNSN